MKICVGSDHRGFRIKSKLIAGAESLGHDVQDMGAFTEQSVDYPDFASQVCQAVSSGNADRGILVCGTGMGMTIAANKFTGIRAANCYDEVMAEMCRRQLDVNVLCLPGDLIGDRPVNDLLSVWLSTEFEEGRHTRRVEKVNAFEGQK